MAAIKKLKISDFHIFYQLFWYIYCFSLQDVEHRKTEPSYYVATIGREPETYVREDIHELEGNFATDNVELMKHAPPVHGG